MTREEKILALTRYELQYLIDNPEWLDDNAKFFVGGGFTKWTDDELNTKYRLFVEIDGEVTQ